MKKLQDLFIDFLTRNLLKGITEKDVFEINKKMSKSGAIVKQLKYKGKEVNQDLQMRLKEEAVSLKSSAIWKMISNRIRWQVYDNMFHKSKNEDDMRAGKLALYILNLIENLLKELAEL